MSGLAGCQCRGLVGGVCEVVGVVDATRGE